MIWDLRFESLATSDVSGGAGEPPSWGQTLPLAPVPLYEGWSLSAGWAFGDGWEPAAYARLRYLRFQDPVAPAWEGTDTFEYGIGTSLAITGRTSLSLGLVQRHSETTWVDPASQGYWGPRQASDTSHLNLGLSFGPGIVTSFETSLGTRTPEVLLSIRFPCCF
jgi:hypothetical protein